MIIKIGGLAKDILPMNAYRLHKHMFFVFCFFSEEASLV